MYAIYLRKSRADIQLEALGQGETLARHRRTLQELANAKRLPIGETYEEIVSGDTIADRPEMQRLLHDVQSGAWEGVLVMEVERLARGDSLDQGIVAQAFKFTHTLIITPMKTYDPDSDSDEEFFEFSLFMARREYKTIKRRMQAGRLASAKEGNYQSPRIPLGYVRQWIAAGKGCTLAIDPATAPIVRMVFDLYLHQSIGCNRIAARLNDLDVRTWSGKPWTRSGVRDLLINPIYVGRIRWFTRETSVALQNGRQIKNRVKSDRMVEVEGKHPPIIDEATWNAVQAMMRDHSKPPTNSSVTNPLRGLVRCSECGRLMQLQASASGGSSGKYQYSPVKYLRCFTPNCPTVRIDYHYVVSAILDALKSWIAQAEAPAPTIEPVDQRPVIEAAQNQLNTLAAQLDRARDMLEQGIYDIPTYVAREQQLKLRMEECKSALADLQKAIPAPSFHDQLRALSSQLHTVLSQFSQTTDPAMQNVLLRSVVDHVVYHRLQRTYRGQTPSSTLTIEVFPKLVDVHEPFEV